MMNKINLSAFILVFTLIGCEQQPPIEEEIVVYDTEHMQSPVRASLRGLSVLNDSTAWFSGSRGTWMYTQDKGVNWVHGSISDSLDFRDIHAFNLDTVILMNAGFPGLVLKTFNRGLDWDSVFYDNSKGVFFDDISFWDNETGIMFGDAIGGKIPLVLTTDGGSTWSMLPENQLPDAIEGEGGFAASGTNVITAKKNEIYIATTKRILYTKDLGLKWKEAKNTLGNGNPSSGIFSFIQFQGTMVAVGGDFLEPDAFENNYGILYPDLVWSDVLPQPPTGYRSSVAAVPELHTMFCTGPNGTDISLNKGVNWQKYDTVGYHAVKFHPDYINGWMSGSAGRVARILVSKNY